MRHVSTGRWALLRAGVAAAALACALLGGAAGAVAQTVSAPDSTSRPRTAARPQEPQDVPSLTDDTYTPPPPPLRDGWPVGAKDVQFRGAACDEGYSPEGARKKGTAGDDAMPTLDVVGANLPRPMLAVRHVPFLTKRDVASAQFTADSSAEEVR